MAHSTTPTAGWILKTLAIPVYLSVGAFFGFFFLGVFIHLLLNAFFDEGVAGLVWMVTTFVVIGVVASLPYFIGWLAFKAAVLLKEDWTGKRQKKPALVVRLFGRRFIERWGLIGVVAGMFAFWLRTFANGGF